ncbi:hypothetical protein Poli38472_005482 [Pythium oligandrum]|uniref:Uncharacterized protein n=1 Tax=Pythium oligandrum TaxID=41045 RepID=A0A8K1FJ86_PYTOL|nr:hypothetical protein Poli38472_005482 [Pythium oligandrum]|eukprot:TMW62864.1 hypothetical protein Poli38472_005482 [Pythium oligandrum]
MGNTVTLHSACAYSDLAAVRRLLKTCTEAEIEARDDNGRTPLLVAVAAMKRRNTADDDDDELNGFGFHDDEDEDDEFEGTNEPRDEHSGNDGDDEGDDDESLGDGEVVELEDDASIEPIAKEAEILHLLLQRQVNLDHQDENGWTALHHACFIQNAVAIRMLVQAGAHPMRDSYGLLPQDFLMRGQSSEWIAQAQELKELMDQITEVSPYFIKLLAFRPSGIVQLDMGAQVEKGSFVTIEYNVPENHSPKDYIQVLISAEDSPDVEIGTYHQVPAGSQGQITISTQDIPSSSTIRFVYVKTDINTISRKVVASGCNAVVQASVGEIFQYELFLYERVVEVESIPEFEFIDQPLIILKRIGIVAHEGEIDWVEIRPDNHIVAVNDIRIDTMEFPEAVRVLQENNGKKCTKLLMQNYSACGDFIPEKILGVGVVGKFAFLQAIHDDDHHVSEQRLDDWVGDETRNPPPAPTRVDTAHLHSTATTAEPETPSPSTEAPVEAVPALHEAVESKLVLVEADENPAAASAEDKVSLSSTIETVVPLHNSRQLVEQLHHGISSAVR